MKLMYVYTSNLCMYGCKNATVKTCWITLRQWKTVIQLMGDLMCNTLTFTAFVSKKNNLIIYSEKRKLTLPEFSVALHLTT